MKPPPGKCLTCGRLVAGFRGRLIHVDGDGSTVRVPDHEPVIRHDQAVKP